MILRIGGISHCREKKIFPVHSFLNEKKAKKKKKKKERLKSANASPFIGGSRGTAFPRGLSNLQESFKKKRKVSKMNLSLFA